MLVRGHEPSPKYLHLLEALRGHDQFSMFALYRGRPEELEQLGFPTLGYDLDDMVALGFQPDSDEFIYLCCDLLLEHARRKIPGFDFYIMIEYDVGLGGDGAIVADLVAALSTEKWRSVDMAVPELSEVRWDWFHARNAGRFFSPAWASFPPVWVLSERAVRRAYQFRVEEGPPDLPASDRVICEAMASLFVNDPAFQAEHLNTILPGCYDYFTFYFGLPMLDGTARALAKPEFKHPLYDAEHFLKRHLIHAEFVGDLAEYSAAISDPDLPLPHDVRKAYAAQAQQIVAWRPPRTYKPVESGTGMPPAILLVDDADLPVRDSMAGGSSMFRVNGHPLFRHVIARLHAAGVTEIAMCAGRKTRDIQTEMAEEFSLAARPDIRLWSGPSDGALADRLGRILDDIGQRRILLAYGNVWSDLDPNALLAAHDGAANPMTLALAQGCSVNLALEEAIRVTTDAHPGFGDLRLEAGAAVIEPELFGALREDRAEPVRSLIRRLRSENRLTVYDHTGIFSPVNSCRDAAVLQRLLLEAPERFKVEPA